VQEVHKEQRVLEVILEDPAQMVLPEREDQLDREDQVVCQDLLEIQDLLEVLDQSAQVDLQVIEAQ